MTPPPKPLPPSLQRRFYPKKIERTRVGPWLGTSSTVLVAHSRMAHPSVVTKTVRALDLTTNGNNTPRWQRKARMLVPRYPPCTVVVGGKIYALGGSDPADKPWAEVYDPTSNIWEALPPPPKIPEPGYEFLSARLEDDNDREKGSIIVLSVRDELLLQYNVANRSWNMSKLQRWSGGPACRMGDPSGPALAVGRMVYWFSCRSGHLYGVHLDTHKLYESELVMDVPSNWVQRPLLGHLGGHKFFLLHGSFYESPKAGVMMHCVKFSVALVDARKEMTISLESSQSFVIKAGQIGNGCVVMSSH
ncbi:hypothetical protein Tsubulata_026052 [Turnera subulata]|uniref:F-box/kelch-repeat protein n=1 Tax=Turnera subulata TaxID=218843 RepID=A0A9Q0JK26_9ROSI|nr:hypothetical protein Tsubulata_026052 [Turnera subulata]